MTREIDVKTKFIYLPLVLLNLITLILFAPSNAQPTAAQQGEFESCSVQNGRYPPGDPNQGQPKPNDLPESECEALVSLYNSTNGHNWRNNLGWLTDSPCSSIWAGVFCWQGHVQALHFNYNQLSGSIPPQIGNLPYLQFLDLSDNQLTGTIPPQIGNLTSLHSLYLHINQLSGSIPPQIGNLTQVQRLWLHVNQLSGSIPPQIGNLTQAQDLWLQYNQLSGNIPSRMEGLTQVQRLYLNNNQLSGSIPPQIGNLTRLQRFLLSNNQLSGNIPPQIGDLTNLQALFLNNNRLAGELPATLTNLPNLDEFTINYTCLNEPQDATFQAWLNTINYFQPNTHPLPSCGWSDVEIKLRAFIPCGAVWFPPILGFPPLLGNDELLGGDGYSGTTQRALQKVVVNVAPGQNPTVSGPIREWGQSSKYSLLQGIYILGEKRWCWEILSSEHDHPSGGTAQLVVLESNNRVKVFRTGNNEVRVNFFLSGSIPPILIPNAPPIDANIDVYIRQEVGKEPQFKASGKHDGFPAFELYIDGTRVYCYDPLIRGKSPQYLFFTLDESFNLGDWKNISSAEECKLSPGIRVNYPIARPVSFITLTGTGFAANTSIKISINGHVMSTVSTDSTGRFEVSLNTTNADLGNYIVSASPILENSNTMSTMFRLEQDAPLFEIEEGISTVIDIPPGIGLDQIYLPLIIR